MLKFVTPQNAGRIVVGQALRLLVAAVPVGGVLPTRVRNENALRTRLRSFGVAGSEAATDCLWNANR